MIFVKVSIVKNHSYYSLNVCILMVLKESSEMSRHFF